MDQPRLITRASLSHNEYENARRNSEQSSIHILPRSKSPLRNYRENTNITNQSLNDSHIPSFTKTQALNLSHQKTQYSYNITSAEPAIKTIVKQSDIPKKFEGFKRAGSMQVTNINMGETIKETPYNFIPPQNLQTITNGNSNHNHHEKAPSSGANTLTSGGMSSNSFCKNCRKLEEQDRVLVYSLNQLLNQITDVVDKEKMWRQGNLSLDADNFGWNGEEDPVIDPKIFKKTDGGRLLLEIKKQFLNIRKSFEEHIIDIESLSKTSVFKDVHLLKENKAPSFDEANLTNPGKKLLSSISEAKQYIESLRSVVFSEEIPPEIKEDIRSKSRQGSSEDQNVMRTLMLQLEQSKRERRVLEVELTLQKRGVLQGHNNVNSSVLKQIVRQVIDEQIRAGKKEDLRKKG